MAEPDRPVAIITGCNSGFGRAAALLFARRRCRVYATVRSAERGAELTAVSAAEGLPLELVVLDVTDEGSCRRAVERVVADAGRLDVLVNNAGRVMYAAVEETTDAEARSLFDTNFFGALNMIRAVLPTMRARGAGVLVTVSSVNGIVNLPYSALYGASKWAVEAVTQALHLELSPFGIRTAIVQPAGFETAIVDNALDVELPRPESPYWPGLQATREASRATNAASPDLTPVAEAIWAAAFDDDDRLRHPVGHYADLLSGLRREMTDEELLDVLANGVRNYRR